MTEVMENVRIAGTVDDSRLRRPPLSRAAAGVYAETVRELAEHIEGSG